MRKVLLLAIIGAALWILFALFAGRPQLNVLLISVDTLRPDHLGCYGYADIRTPAIDRLAAEGVVFTDAGSAVPLTLPSHATILTGLYPPSHGIRDNGFMPLPGEIRTLAEVLKDRGYATCAVVGAFVLDSRYGLDQGFDTYDDDLSGGRQPREFGYAEISADEVTRKALAWLEEASEPFFAFVHYYDPHTTYDPPEPYATTYAERLYDGEIAYTDQAIGHLIDSLEATGVLERTLVVLLSDHGEGLGQHDEPTHGVLVYESTLRVPLIIRAPGGSDIAGALPPGSIRDTPLGLVDIYDSVLDLLGISVEHATDGVSFINTAGRPAGPAARYFESLYPRIAYRWSPLRGVRVADWKYILAPEEELYNLADDPGELKNLAELDAERARELRVRTVELAGALEKEEARSGRRPDQEEIRKLRALGYVSGGSGSVPAVLDTAGADPKHMMAGFSRLMGGGEDALAAGDLDTALEQFSHLVELDPGNPQARVFRARVLMGLGRLDEAVAEYLRVTRIDSTNSTPYFHLGNIAHGRGRLEEALAYYRRALELVPGSPEVLANMGGILIEKGLADSAEVVLRQALEGDPKNKVATVNLGLISYRRGDNEKAIELFRRTLVLDPENVKALANMAAIYASEGLVDSTVKYLEAAAEVETASASILANLGNAYRQKGLFDRAEVSYERSLAIDPDNVLSLFGMAAIRVGQGQNAEAEVLLRRLLTVRPDFEPARTALHHLRN